MSGRKKIPKRSTYLQSHIEAFGRKKIECFTNSFAFNEIESEFCIEVIRSVNKAHKSIILTWGDTNSEFSSFV